jgi:hypothetical protein
METPLGWHKLYVNIGGRDNKFRPPDLRPRRPLCHCPITIGTREGKGGREGWGRYLGT